MAGRELECIPVELIHKPHPLIPAQAGIQGGSLRILCCPGVPAFAGTNGHRTPVPPDRDPQTISMASARIETVKVCENRGDAQSAGSTFIRRSQMPHAI